jgi:RNA polymerase sigma-70 factor (family 1)
MQDNSIKNDNLLVQNLSKSNILAFNSLYKKYSRRLYRFAYGYLKSEEEAEELVQEVFTIIWEKRKELKEELSFKSFLFSIAFNIIRKHFRTKAYLTEYLKSGVRSELDLQTTNQVVYNSLFKFIFDVVNQLPQRRKEIFNMSRVQGCSIKEIAEELKISHKTVENQLSSALKFIRTNLNRENDSIINY